MSANEPRKFQASTAAAVTVSSPVFIPSGKSITADVQMLISELRYGYGVVRENGQACWQQ